MYKNDNNGMSEMFKGYSDYTDEEYRRIWDKGLIVLDTNVLLDFYRYSNDSREQMIDILNSAKKRLWIPYQVGYEYFKNKNKVISSSYNDYDELLKSIKCGVENSINEIKKKKNNSLQCKKIIIEKLENTLSDINKIVIKEKEEKNPNVNEKNIEKELFSLFNDSIGAKFSEEEEKIVCEEGKNRINNKIPPGYMDDDKEENGDYYIFYSMMKYAKENEYDVIFVTGDTKEDWFNDLNGEKRGGRYELLNEFYQYTGHLLLIYTPEGFVSSYSKNIKNQSADENFIKELNNIRRNNNYHDKDVNDIFYVYNMVKSRIRHKNMDYEEYKYLVDLINKVVRTYDPKSKEQEFILKKILILRDELMFNKLHISNKDMPNDENPYGIILAKLNEIKIQINSSNLSNFDIVYSNVLIDLKNIINFIHINKYSKNLFDIKRKLGRIISLITSSIKYENYNFDIINEELDYLMMDIQGMFVIE